MGADYVATGHYTINELRITNYELQKGNDPTKDQVYFLWTLNQKQLSKIIFPVGNLKKIEVRKLAKKFKLPVAKKKDSQGICFLGAVDLKEFLKYYIKPKKGQVILIPSESEGRKKDNVIGWHDGAVFYTLGERHGFTITKKSPTDGAYYVVGKDVQKNILIVSQKFPPLLEKEGVGGGNFKNHHLALKGTPPQQGGEKIQLKETNWISEVPKKTKSYTCQIRYHGQFLDCKVKIFPKNKAEVIFLKLASGLPAKTLVAAGQSCVVYDGDICLGGGVVV